MEGKEATVRNNYGKDHLYMTSKAGETIDHEVRRQGD